MVWTIRAGGLWLLAALALVAGQEQELKISYDDCPDAVRTTLAREAFGSAIPAVHRAGEDSEAVYEAEVVLAGRKYEILVAADGTLLEKEWEEDDERLLLADCPTPVQKTLRQEACGARLEVVEKERVYGREIYEADALIDGHMYEIKVSAEGALISKKLSRHR